MIMTETSSREFAVRLFAAARQLLNRDTLVVQLSPPLTAEHLLAQMAADQPAIASLVHRCRLAVNSEYASRHQAITPNDAIALIPPVSGG